mgnify:CR=1 FL=1
MDFLAIFSFVGFTSLVAIIAWYATRTTDEQSSDGYFLGGRSLTAGVIAGSLLLTNLSTEQIVGLNGSAYKDGLSVMAWETLAAIAMVVTAVLLLPRYLKGGLTTVPQFLATRFDVSTKTITSGLFLTGYVVVLLPVILYSGSVAISGMFDVPGMFNISDDAALVACIWGIGIIGSIYAVFGGLKAVAVSDSINAIGLIIGGILIPVFGLMAIGDGSILTGLDNLMNTNPERFDSTGETGQEVPFSTIFTGMMLVQLFYWGTNQQIIQRALGAKSLAEGQKGLLLAAFLKILGPLILVLPGMIAYHYFDGGLASSDLAYPELVRAVLPKAMVGFFAAVLFGAILSSFNSVLNSSVTLFGIDIYKQHINKDATEGTVVKYGKIFGVCLALAAMFIAPLIANAGSLFNYLQEINGIYSIPILTIIVVGYLTKRVPAIAAKIGILSGSILYIISQFFMKPNFVESALAEANAAGMTDAAQLAKVEADAYPHYLHVMAILFVSNILIMLLIGKFMPRKEPFELQYTQQVNIEPYKYVKQVGLVVVAIVVGIYIYFAK